MELEQPSLPGVPKMLRRDCLPTKRDIFDHYLYMRKARQESGEWKQNTPLSIAVGEVLTDVREQWDKTGIPPFLLWEERREGHYQHPDESSEPDQGSSC